MHRLKIFIRTLAPVVISAQSNSTIMTETHAAFSGSIIRGVLAARYLELKKNPDADFWEIFYGAVKFSSANPAILNERAINLPLSLQQAKAGTKNENAVQDLLVEKNPARGNKSLRGYGLIDGDKIYTTKIKTTMFMHMSRSGDTERLAGRSVDGQIYNYEAIDAEQDFQGEIIGGAETLRKLIDSCGEKFVGYIGKSRFTQYGRCLITFGEIEEFLAQDISEKFYLRLDTPLISEDNFISAEKILQVEVAAVLEKICAKKFQLGKIFSAGVEVENFVVPWGMKRPRVMALAAGTVFEIAAENLTDADKKIICEKMYSGFGIRTEEGFGQMRIWRAQNLTKCKPDEIKIAKPENFSAETIDLAKKILMSRVLEQIRIYANEDAEKLRPQLRRGNFTHFFSRLNGLISAENFKQQLELEIRDGSLFQAHLKNLQMSNGQKFYDALLGEADLPYKSRNLAADLGDFSAVLDALEIKIADFDKKIYHEYLRNYFRFARKIASDEKGADA